MIVWTPTAFECLICTCSAQLSMFHMEKRSRNTLTIIVIIGSGPLSMLSSLQCGKYVGQMESACKKSAALDKQMGAHFMPYYCVLMYYY